MTNTLSINCSNHNNVLFKGTTPIFNFTVELDTTLLNLEETHIVFTSGSGVIDKTNTDITVSTNLMTCNLTQEDTITFTGTQVNIQILGTMSNGQKVASNIMCLPVYDTLIEGDLW